MLTPDQLDEIEAGCEGVTPGPWEARVYTVDLHEFADVDGPGGQPVVEVAGKFNAAHIARLSHEVVRELVRGYREGLRVSELEEENERLRQFYADSGSEKSHLLVLRERDRLRAAIEAHEEALNRARENGEGDAYEWEISETLWAVLDDA